MATKKIFNAMMNVKGAGCCFKTIDENTYVVGLFPDGKSIPVIVTFNSKNTAVFPDTISDDEQALYSTVLQQLMVAYPTIGYKYGLFYPSKAKINYADDFPLVEFLPRTMGPGRTDTTEKQYRKMLSAFYPFAESVGLGTKPRVAEESYDYPPFKEQVLRYKELPEFEYDMRPVERRVMQGVANGTISFIHLQGYPGTGKTTFLKVMAMRLGLPYRESVGTFDNNDQLVGCFAVSSVDGELKPVFLPGPLLECYEHGGVYILNEANYTRQDVLSTIQGMTDGSLTYHEKTSKRLIKRHANFVLGFTINPKAKGSLPLNEALFNRFSVVINYDKASSAEILERLVKLYPDGDKDFLTKLSTVPDVVEAWARQLNSAGFCSIRQLTSFFDSVSNEPLSLDDFKEEFLIRIINPVCTCNTFDLARVSGLVSSQEYSDLLEGLYSLYGTCANQPVDYEWLVSGATSPVSSSSDDDVDSDEVLDALKNFKSSL